MLLDMYITFFKIGAFSFGGGYGMIPVVQREIVDKRKWIDETEFMDAMAVAQGAPGPMAVNVSIYVGFKVHGISGAIVAFLGSVMPSFFIMIFVAKFFDAYRNNPYIDRAFNGVRPAVVGLILAAVYSLTKTARLSNLKLLIALLVVILIAFLNVNPIYLILLGAVSSILINKYNEKKDI